MLFMFKVVAAMVEDVVPKSKRLNQLPVVSVGTEAPDVNVRLGAFADVPPVVPQVNVLVTLIAATVNPPVPVYVKPVSVAMLNTVVAAVVCVSAM